ncbi:MAG: ABC transporter permease [Lachnospiraceae bacterium]|nr:ABC transporter permease [Lachnospiraceae bacterium]MBP5249687.1 ABC transporter permease [Lachnospiraceae bacterium]
MKEFVESFKKYAFFLSQLVKKEIKLKYRSSYLGVIWTLLEPLLTMIVLTVVFTRLFGRDTNDYPVYILTGRLLFTFYSGSTMAALKSVRSHAGMIKKVYVPKYMYPLSGILSNYVTFLISLIVLAVVSLVRGVYPTLWLFQALVPLIVVFFLALGTGLILSTVAVFFRDLEYLWGVATMIIMYASAIFYKTETVATERNIWIFRLNPVYAVIDNFRSAVFGGPMDLGLTAYAAGVSAALVVLGAFVFSKNQDRFILHL